MQYTAEQAGRGWVSGLFVRRSGVAVRSTRDIYSLVHVHVYAYYRILTHPCKSGYEPMCTKAKPDIHIILTCHVMSFKPLIQTQNRENDAYLSRAGFAQGKQIYFTFSKRYSMYSKLISR